MAFGTRSVVKLDGLDWLDGLVRRGVDGRDCNVCVCMLFGKENSNVQQQNKAQEYFLD